MKKQIFLLILAIIFFCFKASGQCVTAGSNMSMCKGTTSGALGGSYGGAATSAIWSTSSGGSFANNSGSTPGTATWTPTAGYTGTATLTLTAHGSSCEGQTDTKTVTVHSLPTVSFTSQPGADACLGVNVTYTTQASMSNYTWTYDGAAGTDYDIVSGGGTSDNSVVLKWIKVQNNMNAFINYTDANGCTALSATTSTPTDIHGLPTVTFTAQPGAGPDCGNVELTYTTQGSKNNYIWVLPGTDGVDYTITAGGGGTNATTKLKYLTSGSKVVTVNYEDVNNCTAASPTSSTATSINIPAVTFTAEPGADACLGIDVTYTTESGMGSSYVWGFPGTLGVDYSITTGGGSSDHSVTLHYLTTGSKVVTINYTSSGCSAISPTSSTATMVHSLPTPTFTAQPGADACLGVDVTYTTESGMGSSYVWGFPGTPGVDYSITTGGGSSDNSVTLHYLTTGSKTVTINYNNSNGCTAVTTTSSTATTVHSLPAVTYNVQPGAGPECAGASVIYTTQSGMGSSYVWGFPGTPGVDYNISSGGGSSNNTVTLSYLTTGSKTVTINYIDGNGCTAVSATSSIATSIDAPTVTFTAQPGADACLGIDVTYTTESGMGSSYVWGFPGTLGVDYSITTGGGSSDHSVTLHYLTTGSKVVTINYTSSGCSAISPTSSTATMVHSLPTPTFTAQPGADACLGVDVTYTTESGMGSSYVWGFPGTPGVDYSITTGGGSSDNSVTLHYLTSGSKTVTINYNNSNGCTAVTTTSSTATTVHSLPAVTYNVQPGAGPECAGASVIYTTQSGMGSSYVWGFPGTPGVDYNISSGGGSSNNTVTLSYLTTGSKTVTINYIDGNGCTAVSATSSIATSIDAPTVTFTAQPGADACLGIDVTYTTESGMGSSYVWGFPGTLGVDYSITTGGGSSDHSVTLHYLTTGSKVVTINYTSSGCSAISPTSSTATMVHSLPTPTFTAQPGADACLGVDVTYTTESGMGSSYVWGFPGTPGVDYSITTGGGSSDNSVTLHYLTSGSKTVTINYNNSNGCTAVTATSSTATTVNPLPASITGTTTVCEGSMVTLSDATVGGAWSSMTLSVATIDGSGVVSGISTGTSLIKYTLGTGCYESTTVTVDPKPILSNLNATKCSDEVLGITLSTTNTPASSYDITLLNQNGLSASAGSPGTGTGLAAGVISDDAWTNTTASPVNVVYTIIPNGSNGCTGDPYTVTIAVNPEPVGNNDVVSICSKGTLNYNLQGNINGHNSVVSVFKYTVLSSDQAHVPAASDRTVASSGNITDSYINTTGSAVLITYTVTPFSSSNNCQGSDFTYKVTVNPEPVGSNDVVSICSKGTLNYDLQGNINGHNSVTSVFKYTVLSSDPTHVPAASDRTVASSGNITDSYINTTGSAVLITYTVTPFSSSNNCQGSDFTYKVTVNPEPVGSNDVVSICSKGTLNYDLQGNINGHNSVTSVFTYTVSSSDPTHVPAASDRTVASSGNITDSYINTTGSAVLITYTVTPFSSSNNCQGSDFTYKVTVNPEPVGSNDVASICSKGTLNYNLQGNINGHNSVTSVFTYTVSSSDPTHVPAASDRTVASSGNITDSYINTTGSAVLITYTVTSFSSSNNCQGSDFTYKVTVNPEPVGSNDVASICSKGSLNYDLQGNINGHNSVTSVFTYTVSSSDPTHVPAASDRTVASSGNITDSYINTTGSAVLITYTVTPFSSSNNCQGSDFTYKVTVNPEPVGSNDVVSICSKGTLNYNLQGNINGHNSVVSVFKYTVLSSDQAHVAAAPDRTVASSANITDSYTNTTGSAVIITYTVTPYSSTNNCQGSDFTYTVTVNPEPVLSNLNTTVCSDVVTGVTLSDVHSLADRFEIVSITPQSGLIASGTNSTAGADQLANAILNDTWTNKTAGALTVTYAIIPRINGGCIGDQKNVVVTINPEPDLVTPAPTVCSNAVTGITLTDVHSLANSFEIVSETPTGSMTPGVGNATISAGKLSSAITSDIWTNLTTVTQTVTYAIIPRISGGCIGDQENIVVTVNPATTLTGASQLATVCHNSSATINLLGLLPGSTFDLSYSINGVSQTAITGLMADASGNSSFSTPALSSSLNGKILRVTGINVTSESPNCVLSFTSDVSLKVDPATVPGTVASAQTICSGASPVDLTLSGNTGTIVKWQKSIDSFANATEIPVTSSVLPGSTIGNLTLNTQFRAVVQSGVCSLTYSTPVQVTINALPTPTITGPAPVNVTSSGNNYTTETGKTSYSWNVSGAGNTITGGSGTNSITVTWNLAGDQAVTVNYIDANLCTAASPPSKTVHVNALPVASNITILGDPRSNITLNTFYSYSDAESDLEGTSVFQWYKGTDASGTGSTAIASATARTYKLKDADTTYYIGFSVIPFAQAGATPGTMATSAVWVGPVTNAAPTASSVAISGSKNVGGVLTGHYTYSDLENDLESGTLFQWYSSTSLAGTYNPISGEVYNTHLIENTEQGKYFQFRVTPKAATGKTSGYEVVSASYGPANSQPYADNVTVSGSVTIGSTLTGSYSYHDSDGDLQGTSTFRWLRTNISGTTVISGATGLTYNLTSADEGYTITFEVSPVALTGYPTNGTPVTASTSGPVLDPSVSVPVADQVCISGIRKTGEILTGKYNYTFYKSEGTSGYRWLLNNGPISGATNTQYTLTQSDIDSGQDIVFEVIPKSSNYIPKVGLAVTSTPLARIKITQTNYSLADTAFVLVPNVSGGVFSGVGVSNGYFSPWNADTAIKPPHTVKYDLTITNSITTCSERASVDITVVPVNAYFVGLNGNYCYDDKPDTIFVKNVPTYATNRTYKSTNPASIIKIINSDTIIIDPNKKRPGISKDTLSYSYLFNGSYYPITQSYTTDSVGVALINNLSDNQIFCNNDAPFTLYPSLVGAGGVFTGPVTPTVSGSYLLDPSKGIGNTSVTFKFTHANTGCFSAITVPITINPAPSVSFKPANVCVVNTSTDSIRFTNKTVSVDPISTWLWEFFDAGGSSTKGEKNPAYLYKIGGDHRVTLKATTSKNCSAISDTTIGIGFRPVSNFRWKNDCYHPNDSIMFFDSTTSTVAILSRTWKFGTSPVVSVNNVTNPKFLKSDTGYLAVRYIVRTSYSNCNDSVTKMVYIRPTIQLTTADYFQNFEGGKHGWVKDLEISNNSWSFGLPNRKTINSAASGNSAWFTSFDITKQKVESSWINSPCFDFTAINRPMMSLKLWKRFELNRDGGKIQYTIGDVGTWQAVGTVDDGINWYNSALIKGAPGGDGLGWTDTTSGKWVESRHKIDELQGKKDVKFRIAYGSDGLEAGQYNDGLAFDDIRIGQRTRKVMLEHFTNAGSKSGSQATTLVTDLANKGVKDIINIQYHSDFPGSDKFYTFNPGEVSSRLLFYGLSRIPYAFVDGGTNISDTWSKTYSFTPTVSLDSTDLIKRSLINPLFSITLDTTFTAGTVTLSGQIKALSNINAGNITLYLAVTEKQNSTQTGALGETKFYNIFRKFIPDATGISLKSTWAANDTYTFTDKSWKITGIPNNSGIEIIAFIQNNVTKEIYQAQSVVKASLNTVVGIDNVLAGEKNEFGLYPNPASDILTITFMKKTGAGTEITIFDFKGSVIKTYKVGSGLSDYTINDTGLQNGIYLVRVKSGGLDLGYKKLIISRN